MARGCGWDTFTTTYDPAGYMAHMKNAEKQMLYMSIQARYDAETMNPGL